MIGQARLLQELRRVITASPADGTIACAQAQVRRVSRFAYGVIHQDIWQECVSISVKVMVGRRSGVASTDSCDAAGLRRCLDRAMKIARIAPPVNALPPLAAPSGRRPGRAGGPRRRGRVGRRWAGAQGSAATLARHPAPDTLQRLFHACEGLGAQLAGSCVSGHDEMAVVNSAGVVRYHASAVSGAKLVTMYRRLSGFASGARPGTAPVDLEQLLERALRQCLHRREALTLPVGTYEVILEPEAIGELITWLGYTAFGAKQFQERTSCLAGRMGERVMAPGVTIYDDGNDPAALAMPFDVEGVPKQRVALIDRGTAAGIVYDSTYGHAYHQPSTGHALALGDADGPLPLHLGLAPGTVSRDHMIRRCRRGLLIPRFHYVNGLLNPREALMTGLTREGAWLIEDGKPVAPITTLRFTQSLLEALSHVTAISAERALVADPAQEAGCAMMPSIHLKQFRFTGRSEPA